MKTKQIVFTGVNTVELLETEYEAPKANQVVVSLEYSAVSAGTERANITGDPNIEIWGENKTEAVFPRCCGYSSAGIVTETGSGITDLKCGDRVAVYYSCHKKMLTMNRDCVVKLPEEVSTKEAAMAYISTFPLAAVRKTRVEIGESAMVMGLGILGLFAVQELKAAGAVPVIAVDPLKDRRELALRMGADYALDPTDTDFCRKVKDITGGGVNVAIEVTGLGQGLIQVLDCMARLGRVALLGCTRNPDFHIDYYRKVHGPGITIVGAHTSARKGESYPGYWTNVDDMKTVIRLIQGKRLNFKDMIHEIHKPEEAVEVYERLINDRNFPIGVLFDWTKM